MENLYDLEHMLNAQFVWGSDSAPTNNVAKSTADSIVEHVEDGYTIFVGNNPYMDKSKKWASYNLKRLAQTNSRNHGKSIRTIWAAKEK